MSNTINAAANPEMANNLIENALKETKEVIEPTVKPPSDNVVNLPGGLLLPTGEIIRTAEVKELTGRDEEAIGKTSSVGKAIMITVDRATVKLGGINADEKHLYNLLAGDRDALLLGIFKATFGPTVTIPCYCDGCKDFKEAVIDIDEDIKTRQLVDPVNDRVFTLPGKRGDIVVQLPNGYVQRELLNNSEKTSAELSSILLEKCILTIDGAPVLGRSQVQNLNIVDRRKVLEEIDKRVPGPQMSNIVIDCPDCGGKVGVPINFGNLFQF